jgi:uncharacterized membrane protein
VDWNLLVGRFHVVLLHMPIGLVFAIGLIEAVRWITGSDRVMGSARVLAPAAAASAILTAALGFVLARNGGYAGPTVILHQYLGIFAALVTTGTAVLLWMAVRTPTRYLTPYRLSLGVALASITVAGHLGASITHGPEFLTVQAVSAQEPADASCAEGSAAQTAAAILETKCVRCHGAGVSLGKLRLDEHTYRARGGSSGTPGLVPGDPAASSVIRAVLLDPSNPKAMPPGPHKLTGTEMVSLIEWVQQGAVSCE